MHVPKIRVLSLEQQMTSQNLKVHVILEKDCEHHLEIIKNFDE